MPELGKRAVDRPARQGPVSPGWPGRVEAEVLHADNRRFDATVRRDRRRRHGGSEMHVERDGKEQRFNVGYLAVYTQANARWRMIDWQSTRQPDE